MRITARRWAPKTSTISSRTIPTTPSNGTVYRGKDGARQVFVRLLSDVPQAEWALNTVFADDVLYLEWKAVGGGRKVDDGIDTFIFADGGIRVQTVIYHVGPA